MFDIGGLELLVIAATALIVVGPKELPGLVRNVGQWVARARNMAREFQQGMEAAAKEADVEEFRQIGKMKSELEDEARGLGRGAQSLLDEHDEPPARRAAKAGPRPAPERRAGEERTEPEFDNGGGSGYADRPRRPGPRENGRAPVPRDYGDDRRASAPEPPADPDDPLERFQSGMRRGE